MSVGEYLREDLHGCPRVFVNIISSFYYFSSWKMIPIVLKKKEVVHKAFRVLVVHAPGLVGFPR